VAGETFDFFCLFVLQDQVNQMSLNQMTGTGCFAADLDFV
jgi:hypothetical protein